MPTLWLKEFTGGLDTRRLPETTSGGVLIRGLDGHISRGGEFDKRPAFVRNFVLPSGTVGLAATTAGLVVFGSGPAPSMPVGVTYQRLQHPDASTALVRVPSWDLYAGKVYAVGEFADGSRYHFYDGARVTDWADGRARARFTVTGGSVIPAIAASGSFEVTGGTSGAGSQITSITIDGVALTSGAVGHTGNNATTAAAVAAAINSHASTPDYVATSVGQSVVITAATAGTAVNGKAIVVTVGGTATVGSVTTMSGGAEATASTITVAVDGVQIVSAPVSWRTSNSATATAVADAINSFASSPEYTATAVGEAVNIIAGATGTAFNGRAVTFTLTGGFAVTPTALSLSGGVDAAGTFTPGSFVKTIGTRMTSVSGANAHGSGLSSPTKWTTDATGAFFIDMSTQAAGSEALSALTTYQQYVAVFAERVVQIWDFASDPNNNKLRQVLRNVGTASPRSVTDFGDADLFFLDESGLRSLRARDSSNAAATSDIGVPIDSLITTKLRTLTSDQRQRIIGLIEPTDGRFWLSMLDEIYVFSYFPGSKISAWTTYVPAWFDNGVRKTFSIDEACIFARKVYVRSGDEIFVFGGAGATPTYDATEAEAWTPYFDAGAPTTPKRLEGVDAAVTGTWEVRVAMEPGDLNASDKVAIIAQTTYPNERVAAQGSGTHFSLRFKTVGATAARLGAVVATFRTAEANAG